MLPVGAADMKINMRSVRMRAHTTRTSAGLGGLFEIARVVLKNTSQGRCALLACGPKAHGNRAHNTPCRANKSGTETEFQRVHTNVCDRHTEKHT